MASLRLVSLNVERSKHLDLIFPFLKKQNADVVCLQEVMEYDVERFEKELGATSIFAAETVHAAEGDKGVLGVGIFTTLPLSAQGTHYYWGNPDSVPPEFTVVDGLIKRDSMYRPLLECTVEKEGSTFRIGTLHFTWTPDGSANDEQREDLQTLLTLLEGMGEMIICGDLNAPRGGEIFSTLSAKYKDNVPAHFKTSLDPDLHRAGKLDLMVDGVFSSPGYVVSDVDLVFGISDHAAIIATVETGD